MSDVAETKPDPTISAPEGAEKPEETTTTATEETKTEEKPEESKSVTESAAEAVKDTATKTTDSVFSMFGGGPKKEKQEEPEDAKDEPSGSSKAQKGEDEVCIRFFAMLVSMVPLRQLNRYPAFPSIDVHFSSLPLILCPPFVGFCKSLTTDPLYWLPVADHVVTKL